MPVDVVELVANLATQHDGAVAGMAFDAGAARDALARAKAARAVATAARRLARRAESDSVQSLALVADRTMAVTQAMGRVVRTPEGKAFVEAHDQVRAMMRAAAGRPRKSTKAKSPVSTTTPPTNGVVIAKPATSPASLPS